MTKTELLFVAIGFASGYLFSHVVFYLPLLRNYDKLLKHKK